ncbi:hypothetical protein ACFL54_06555 [Planctomycetota bacterium]
MVTMDKILLQDMNECLSLLRRSYIQYISEVGEDGFIISDDEKYIMEIFTRVGLEEAICADRVWDFIEEAGEVPQVMPFDNQITRFNYTTLQFFLGEVKKQKKAAVTSLAAWAADYQGTEAGNLIAELLKIYQTHEIALEEVAP